MKKKFDENEVLRRWKNDSSLREEFNGDFETFLAYEKALANGQIKLHRGSHAAK